MSLERSFGLVTRTLDAKYRETLRAETRLDRRRAPVARSPYEYSAASRGQQQHVDVVLYCFNPHRCKGVDVAFLRQLRRRASIVPVLCKARGMWRCVGGVLRCLRRDALEIGS